VNKNATKILKIYRKFIGGAFLALPEAFLQQLYTINHKLNTQHSKLNTM
jgi:hypothetical protein